MTEHEAMPVLHVTEQVPPWDRPGWYRWVLAALMLAMVTSLLAVGTSVALLVVRLGEQDAEEAEDARAAAERVDLADDLAAAESALECRASLEASAASAENVAQAASVELLIETAEQFDRLLRADAPDPTALQARIVTAREALAAAQDAAAVYVASVDDCAPN